MTRTEVWENNKQYLNNGARFLYYYEKRRINKYNEQTFLNPYETLSEMTSRVQYNAPCEEMFGEKACFNNDTVYIIHEVKNFPTFKQLKEEMPIDEAYFLLKDLNIPLSMLN